MRYIGAVGTWIAQSVWGLGYGLSAQGSIPSLRDFPLLHRVRPVLGLT
jgi:hypothetical protein